MSSDITLYLRLSCLALHYKVDWKQKKISFTSCNRSAYVKLTHSSQFDGSQTADPSVLSEHLLEHTLKGSPAWASFTILWTTQNLAIITGCHSKIIMLIVLDKHPGYQKQCQSNPCWALKVVKKAHPVAVCIFCISCNVWKHLRGLIPDLIFKILY